MRLADLTKHAAGAPLTEAEHAQRVAAARARWRTYGGRALDAVAATGAAAATGVTANLVRRRMLDLAFRRAKAHTAPVLAVRTRFAQRAARHAAAAAAIERQLRQPSRLLPPAIRGLRSMANRADAELRQHIAEHSEEFLDPDTGDTVSATSHPLEEGFLRERVGSLRARADDLRARGKPPQKVKVAGYFAKPSTPTVTRRLRGKSRPVWPDEALLADVLSANAESGDGTVASRRELEDLVARIPRRHLRSVLSQEGVPVPKIVRAPDRLVEAINPARLARPHVRTVEGYPDRTGRRALAETLRADIGTRRSAWREAEEGLLSAALEGARATARVNARPSLAALHALRGVPALGAVGAAALLGGAAAFAASRRLRKAAPDGPEGEGVESVHEAGEAAQDDIAARLGRAFLDFRTFVGRALRGDAGRSLQSVIATMIGRALQPLGAAARAGASAPIAAQVPAGPADPRRTIVFSLHTRSPRVEAFIQEHRLRLAGDLASDQLATIRSVLTRAALLGQPLEKTAQELRQTVGLAPSQAQHVLSYRAGLETLDPRVLTRALRDRRFDRTVRRAIRTGVPLTAEQVQRLVDIYHRRYIAYRAMTIARTEGVGAANNGHIASIADFLDGHPGFTVVKTWIATDDDRTRPDHRGLNGQQVIGLYTPFTAPSGEQVRWPHDPKAAAKEKINCRCTVGAQLVLRTAVAHRGIQTAPGGFKAEGWP